jgi:hypothetical protein
VLFAPALHNGSPDLMSTRPALFAALVMSQTMSGSRIAQHPCAKAEDGGELASDLPLESIGRPEFEPLPVRPAQDRR